MSEGGVISFGYNLYFSKNLTILASQINQIIPSGSFNKCINFTGSLIIEDGVNGYSVKVVPNALTGKDFDFTVDGIPYSYQAESDLTAGFEIEESESSFTLKPKGTLNEVMAAVYPNSEIEDLTGKGYENMFLLVVDSYNGESTVTLAFSIVEGVSGIEIKPGNIYF